jgi:hypothetical protein
MKFYDLSWAALCFQYRSAGDKEYCETIQDSDFLTKLRSDPYAISAKEFENKVISKYIEFAHIDQHEKCSIALQLLIKIVILQPEITALQHYDVLNCDLNDSEIRGNILKIYSTISKVENLWITGTSKILHLINNRLFSPLNIDILNKLNIGISDHVIIDWMELLQSEAREVDEDFRAQGLDGSVGDYLSDKLGYTKLDCQKSLAKFIDEYYWLTVWDKMPVPPIWIPDKSGSASCEKESEIVLVG